MARYFWGDQCTLGVMSAEQEPRRRIIRGLSPLRLEKAILRLEAEGWRRVGGMALATPVVATQPPYWVQSMERGSVPPTDIAPS